MRMRDPVTPVDPADVALLLEAVLDGGHVLEPHDAPRAVAESTRLPSWSTSCVQAVHPDVVLAVAFLDEAAGAERFADAPGRR